MAAPEDASRREALRKAGEEYLEKALEAARQGHDPFAVSAAPTPAPASLAAPAAGAAPSAGSSGDVQQEGGGAGRAQAPGRSARKQQTLDPDVAAFGRAFENAQAPVYVTLYIICQASLFALAKVRPPALSRT